MQKITILIIEDEENIRELLAYNLTAEGYECLSAGDGKTGLEMIRSETPDLIMLDLMLPVMDGIAVVKTMGRENVEIPVIMLTAKAEEVDKVIGLEFGADDYITKPFGVRELIARIKAVLRRYERAGGGEGDAGPEAGRGRDEGAGVIQIGELAIDIPGHEVRVGGKPVVLTFKEFELLRTLARNRGIVLSREQLLDQVWGYEYIGETRTVDVHIRYLRKKLGGDENRYITTVRGVGYKMI